MLRETKNIKADIKHVFFENIFALYDSQTTLLGCCAAYGGNFFLPALRDKLQAKMGVMDCTKMSITN
jgi:hypothetical protein